MFIIFKYGLVFIIFWFGACASEAIKRALPGMIWNHPNRQSGTLPIKLRALKFEFKYIKNSRFLNLIIYNLSILLYIFNYNLIKCDKSKSSKGVE